MTTSGARNERPCVMTIFGASGDLTRRKLIPALYNLEADGLLEEKFRVVGFGRSKLSDEDFRVSLREGVQESDDVDDFSSERWNHFAERISFVAGAYDDEDAYRALGRELSCCGEGGEGYNLYYLALPPRVSETVLQTMKSSGLVSEGCAPGRSRIMLEKPFGLDFESARRLNTILAGIFDESQVYRVDHYLGKDTIRNFLVFRFANGMFEPVWNRKYVDNIQITAAEDIGIEGRGGYYDQAGVVRDIIQNHVMQVLALVTMEPPLAGDAESVRDRKFEVFKSLSPIARGDFVFGQYEGYRSEKKVAEGSETPTFAALRLGVANWRWFGVPVYVRAGKALERKVTEVAIQFREIPLCVMSDEKVCEKIRPNVLYLRIQPDEGIRLTITVKAPGRADDVQEAVLEFKYSQASGKMPNAYERILLDCLTGVPTLFWRADSVEAAWRAVAPTLAASPQDQPAQVFQYKRGSWGPDEANALLQKDGRHWLPGLAAAPNAPDPDIPTGS